MTEIEALTARVAVLEMLVNQLLDGLRWRRDRKYETMRIKLAREAGARDRAGM